MVRYSLDSVVREHVRPSDSVLVIGPGKHVLDDFLPVVVSTQVRRAQGGRVALLSSRLHSEDVSSRFHTRSGRFLREHKISAKRYAELLRQSGGQGGLLDFLDSFREYKRSLGASKSRQLPVPDIHLADALSTGLSRPFHVVFDSDAAGHICQVWRTGVVDVNARHRVGVYAQELFRLVHSGGSAFVFLSSAPEGFIPHLRRQLRDAGFDVSERTLDTEPYHVFNRPVKTGFIGGYGLSPGGVAVATAPSGLLIRAVRPLEPTVGKTNG